jgi:hypothetical protein
VDFWDATKVLVRRWYLALPLLLLTFAGTGYTATAIEADYVLTSYVQLIPPQTNIDEEEARKYPINPWNQLGLEALSQAANYATVDHTFLDRLDAEGNSTNFKITSGDPVAGATIEVIGKTRDQAVGTTDAVLKRYRDSALQLQTQYRVRSQDLITVQRLDQGENLERPGGKVKRAIIAVFGTGMLLTAAFTIGIDALLRRRRHAGDPDGDLSNADNRAPESDSPGVVHPRVYESEAAPARVNGSEAAPARVNGSEAAPARVNGREKAPARVYESTTAPARVYGSRTAAGANGSDTVPAGVYESETASARVHGSETVRIRVPTGTAKNGKAKPTAEPAVPSTPAPAPAPVGDATIVLPAPRTAPDDKGGKRR